MANLESVIERGMRNYNLGPVTTEMKQIIREAVRAIAEETIPRAVQLGMGIHEFDLMAPLAGQITEAAILKVGRDAALDVGKKLDRARVKVEGSVMVTTVNAIYSHHRKEKKLMNDLSMIRKEAAYSKEAMEAQKTVLQEAQDEKTKLADELLSTRKEAANSKRKMEETHKTSLEQVQEESTEVGKRLCQAEREESSVAEQLASTEKEKNELRIVHERCQPTLEEEKEKSLCEICMQLQKDTVCLPCLHLRYCFGCLENHRQLSKTCPCCQVLLNGVIRCDLIFT